MSVDDYSHEYVYLILDILNSPSYYYFPLIHNSFPNYAGYMGECGLRGGYAEIINLDPSVKAMYLKSISAKLCPTTLGQVKCTWMCNDIVVYVLMK